MNTIDKLKAENERLRHAIETNHDKECPMGWTYPEPPCNCWVERALREGGRIWEKRYDEMIVTCKYECEQRDKLKAENERLRKALQPFATGGYLHMRHGDHDSRTEVDKALNQ